MKTKIIQPKAIYSDKWEKTFRSMAPGAAYNAESCMLAALHEVKNLNLKSAIEDIRSAIGFIRVVRESIPPLHPRPKPTLLKKV